MIALIYFFHPFPELLTSRVGRMLDFIPVCTGWQAITVTGTCTHTHTRSHSQQQAVQIIKHTSLWTEEVERAWQQDWERGAEPASQRRRGNRNWEQWNWAGKASSEKCWSKNKKLAVLDPKLQQQWNKDNTDKTSIADLRCRITVLPVARIRFISDNLTPTMPKILSVLALWFTIFIL